jgi:repressor LexA
MERGNTMTAVTDRQQQVLDCIAAYVAAHGYAPTVREIRDRIGVRSTRGVTCHLDALVQKHVIVRTTRRPRGIVIIEYRSQGSCGVGG